MREPFVLSAFADEIDRNLDRQIEALKEMGIAYIEMRGVNGKNIVEVTCEEAHLIKKQLDEKQIKLSAIGSPIGKIGIAEDFEEEIKRFEHILKLSQILEAKYIRMFSFFMPKGEDPENYFDEVLKRWRRYIEAAKGYDVVLLHENEKDIYGDTAKRCKKLLDTLNCESVKLTFDPANFVQVGQDVLEAYEKLRDYIAYVHIKDADGTYTNVPAGKGVGEIDQVLRQLKASGYKGFLSLEPHLSYFQGLELLEKDSQVRASKEWNSYDLFKLAYDALQDLLKTIK